MSPGRARFAEKPREIARAFQAAGTDMDQLGIEYGRIGRQIGQRGGHAGQAKFPPMAGIKVDGGGIFDVDASEAVQLGLMGPGLALGGTLMRVGMEGLTKGRRNEV